MAQSVDPILLDSTGQDMVTALNAIANKTVDSALSTTSTNPVQNKVITGEINGIKDKIPSGASSSNKMATANDITGVQNAVKANTKLIKDTVGFSGKNLLAHKTGSETINGVTFTVNSDGSVTVNGTATANAWYHYTNFLPVKSHNGYILNGCPNGGSSTTYEINIKFRETAVDSGAEWYIIDQHDSSSHQGTEIPNNFNYYYAQIGVRNGQTVNNLVFYPMLRDANILDDTYEPYAGTTAFRRDEQAVLGAKNRLPNGRWVTDDNEITVDVNNDGSVTLNGTTTSVRYIWYANNTAIKNEFKDMILSGVSAIPQALKSSIRMRIRIETDAQVFVNAIQVDNSTDSLIIPEIESGNHYRIDIQVDSGVTLNNVKFYPMIRLASDTDDAYVPYAMTNKELTDSVLYSTNEPIVIATSAANKKWSEQLAELNTAYLTLAPKQQARAFIGMNGYGDGSFYNNARNIAGFTNISLTGSGDIWITILRLSSSKAVRLTVNSSGTMTRSDMSEETNTASLTLYYK